ncbi:MAG: hypothetical protein ACOH2M_17115 [Cypionkella sp.]
MAKVELTKDEWEWLQKLASHNNAMLTVAMADRLKKLGLAEQKLGGTGISSAGKRRLLLGR